MAIRPAVVVQLYLACQAAGDSIRCCEFLKWSAAWSSFRVYRKFRFAINTSGQVLGVSILRCRVRKIAVYVLSMPDLLTGAKIWIVVLK